MAKSFLTSLDLYSKQRTQLALTDPADFHSPLVEVLLHENDGKGDQAKDFVDYIESIGIVYNHLKYWGDINENDILEPLLTWAVDDSNKDKLLKPQIALFPFAVAKIMIIDEFAVAHESVRMYDTLAELKADSDISRNEL
jgi:hypothetical protein